MNTLKTTYKVIDLFAGAGGLSQGLLMVNETVKKPAFEIIKAVEINEAACKSLHHHLSSQKLDVNEVVLNGNLEEENVKDTIINSCQGADIVVGGPPCQTYSLVSPARSGSDKMRKKLANDGRNSLYRHYLEIVARVKPSFILFENVQGIVSSNLLDETTGKESRVLKSIIYDLNELGYDTTIESDGVKKDFLILNAIDYGVPQKRVRIFIIANRLGVVNPVPEKTFGPKTGRPYKTLRSAISDLPAVIPSIYTGNFKKLKKIDLIAKEPDQYLYWFVNSILELKDKFKGQQGEKEYIFLVSVIKRCYEKVLKNRSIDSLKYFADAYNESLQGLDGTLYEENNHPALHICRSHNLRDVCLFSRMKQGTTSAQFLKQSGKIFDSYLAKLYPYGIENHKDTYVKQSWDKPSSTSFTCPAYR